MKKIIILPLLIVINTANIFAQKFIPFQYQNKSKWNFQEKWGLMTLDKKVVLSPTYYNIAPGIIQEAFILLGKNIVEIKTSKIVWDSIESKNVSDIKGNIVRIRMPLRGAVNYQPYSFKNITTKKVIAEEGAFLSMAGYVKNYKDGNYGVVDENGKVIIPTLPYQKIESIKECFVVISDYNSTKFIYDKKGVKLNANTYDKIEYSSKPNSATLAYNLIDKTNAIYEIIFINAAGKEVAEKLYYKVLGQNFSAFSFTENGLAVSKKEVSLYSNKLCAAANKIINTIVINAAGKKIINSNDINDIKEINNNLLRAISNDYNTTTFYDFNGDVIFKTSAYTILDVLGNNLFFASDKTDTKRYFINNKGEKLVNGVSFEDSDWKRYIKDKGFLIYKREFNKLFFNTYDIKTGKSSYGEQFKLGTGIKLEDIAIPSGNYYLVKVADANKQQYATYIYDITGKLIEKSEDGLWMNGEDGTYIKYTLNSKGDKFYIGYFDENLKPYSIINE